MKTQFVFQAEDDVTIYADKYEPVADTKPKGVVLIVHGIVEHAGRYERFAAELSSLGYVTYAHDQRGHGRTRMTSGITTLKENEFNCMVTDLRQLYQLAVSEYPGVPVYMFSHSMGTIVSRMYLQRYGGSDLSGIVLCGPAHLQGMLDEATALSESAIRKHGHDYVDTALLDSVFGALNASFQPARTPADWTTRDEVEVNKYLADPFVQAPVTAGFINEMIKGYSLIYEEAEIHKISKTLPVLIITGDQDPVTEFSEGAIMIMRLYKKAGIKDVKLIIYPQARHELLNEINREEAVTDVIGWITKHK